MALPPPPILLGGSSAAAARRAARIADGWFPPLEPRLWTPYREECLELGKPDPGPYPKHGPIFLWISEQPEAAWDRVMPHVLHQLRSYTAWTIEAFGRALPQVAAATRVWRDFFPSSDEVVRFGHDHLRKTWAEA